MSGRLRRCLLSGLSELHSNWLEQPSWRTAAIPVLYCFFVFWDCSHYPKYLFTVFIIFILFLYAFIVFIWNYLISSVWMLTRSNKQVVIKSYVHQPEDLTLQILPQMFRRHKFSASGKGFLLSSERNWVLYIIAPALLYHLSQIDFVLFARFEADSGFSLALCSPQPWSKAFPVLVDRVHHISVVLKEWFSEGNKQENKTSQQAGMLLHLLQWVSALKLPPGPILFHYCHHTTLAHLWFHNSQQVQWCRVHYAVSKSYLTEELVLELKN